MQKLSQTGLFLLDMDGTFYLEDQLLPGALDFLAACQKKHIPYTFLTNNSSKSKADYLKKLAGLGVEVTEQQMFTSGDATLQYLQKNNFAKQLLLVGTKSLEAQFVAEGYELATGGAKAVVLGFDTGITYQKLTDLCNAVRAGLPYIATHPDFNCPVLGGYIPDIGAVIAFVQAATGRLPDVVVGKPNGLIAQMAAERFGLPVEKLCMVGDRLYTDIALGRAGLQTVLVLSGECTREDLAQSELVPDYVFQNLAEVTEVLNKS